MNDNLDGIWKDYNNNKSCETIQEWQEYVASTTLTHIGVTTCSICGKSDQQISHTGTIAIEKQSSPPAVCAECKSQLIEDEGDSS